MGAYENPQVAIVDYSAFSKNFMQSFAFWSQLWEKRRLANSQNKGKAEEENLKRMQGTFVKPEKELGVMWTNRMTEVFRQQVDQNVWANSSASEKQSIIEKVQTEANGAKAVQQAINLDLTKIDLGTNPDLYGLVNAVQGFSSGNLNKFEMIGGRYNISGDDPNNRSNDSNFTTTPGQIGLTYKYTNNAGKNVYYNADELHDILVNIRDADQLYNSESDKEMDVIAGVVNTAGDKFKTISNSKRLENIVERTRFLDPYIKSGVATENGWDYGVNVSSEIDKWINDEDNYDLAAGIFRNYVPGFESHVYRPSAAQLEQMIEEEGRYIKNEKGDVGYAKWKGKLDEIYADEKVTEEEKLDLWKAQDIALKDHLTKEVWNTGKIDKQFIIPPDPAVIDTDDDDDEDILTVNEIDIADGTQEQLGLAKTVLSTIENVSTQVSSRKANAASLNDPDIAADLKADKPRYSRITELSGAGWPNKDEKIKKYLTTALNKDAKARSENENEAATLYQESMASYDPDFGDIVTGNEKLSKIYAKSQFDPQKQELILWRKDKKPERERLDLTNTTHVRKLYDIMMGAGGDKSRTIYNSLYSALYGKDYFKK